MRSLTDSPGSWTAALAATTVLALTANVLAWIWAVAPLPTGRIDTATIPIGSGAEPAAIGASAWNVVLWPSDAAPVAQPIAPTSPPTLLAILSRQGEPTAGLRPAAGGAIQFLARGGVIDGWTVEAIAPRAVTLRRDGISTDVGLGR